MVTEIVTAVGVLHWELLACQVSVVSAANWQRYHASLGLFSKHVYELRNDLLSTVACIAGVLLGRLSVTTSRPPSVRRWGIRKRKSEKIFFAPPLPYLSFCLLFTPLVELSFTLQSSSTAWKFKMVSELFTMSVLARKNLACSAG